MVPSTLRLYQRDRFVIFTLERMQAARGLNVGESVSRTLWVGMRWLGRMAAEDEGLARGARDRVLHAQSTKDSFDRLLEPHKRLLERKYSMGEVSKAPVFGASATRRAARGIRIFLTLKARIARSRRRITRKGRRIARKGRVLATRARSRLRGGKAGGIEANNLIWIFGAGRSGSTWLMRMMGSLERQRYLRWMEPMVGGLFGSFYNNARKDQLLAKNHILGEPYRESWLHSIRDFVLSGARVRYPGLTPWHYLVIKEPHGSEGAPLLVEALPESRLILLIRDPRDIVASNLDASKRGNWVNERVGDSDYEAWFADADRRPDLFVESTAEYLMKNMMGGKCAYEAHRGPKVLVRYEDLLADTLGTMRRICIALDLPVSEEQLRRAVERHSWENVPEDKKGEGKFFRKANPGSWREDLTPGQIENVERITAPILEEFYAD